MDRLGGLVVIASVHRAGDPGLNSGPGENFSLKLLLFNKFIELSILRYFPFHVISILTSSKLCTGIMLQTNLLYLYNTNFLEVNPPPVATDLRGTHHTSLDALPPLYSVESAHL